MTAYTTAVSCGLFYASTKLSSMP